MAMKIYRQIPSQLEAAPPSSLQYGELACDKNGRLYVGNSANVPIGALDKISYNQVGNPNLLDNSDFTNAVKQRGDTIFDRNGYCIDRWQIFESTYDSTTRTVIADDVVEAYGSQFRQIIDPNILNVNDTVSVSAYINNTFYKFTTTITTFSDSGLISDAPYALETSWGGFKIVLFAHRPEIFFVMFLNPSQKITVNWAKLERGASVTPYVPKGYGQELSECLRYYQRFNVNFRGEAFNVGDGEKYFTTISFYPMRKVPSVTIDAAHYWGGFSGLTAAVEQTDGVYNDRTLRLAVNATAQNPGGAFTAVITLSADY